MTTACPSTTFSPPLPRRAPQPRPEFFVDRSLGRRIVPEALRGLGFVVHAMADVYPERGDEGVTDDRWIDDVDLAGWVALTKDERLRSPRTRGSLGTPRSRQRLQRADYASSL
jgi:hypothetical protein